MKTSYDFKKTDAFWQGQWSHNNTYAALDNDHTREKKYILTEFPFPSGERLHVGHCFRYTVPDVFSRFLRMQGYNVMFPIGYDAFGLPTEEFARKTGKNPKEVTKNNIASIRTNLQSMGYSFDWDRELATTDPEYYKWTQWIFAELYRAGLVEQKEVELWWCEKLSTVLANEEVLDGPDGTKVSERGGHPVEKRRMKQWVIKITEYAEKLLQGLDDLEKWPNHIKEMQRNWIGKSEGTEVDWEVVTPAAEAENNARVESASEVYENDETVLIDDPEVTDLTGTKDAMKLSEVADSKKKILDSDATSDLLLKTTTLLVNSRDEILVLKRSEHDSYGGTWEFPGGGAESRDLAKEAEREVFEETSIVLDNIALLLTQDFLSLEKTYTNYFYSAKVEDDLVVLSDEHSDYQWVTFSQAATIIHFPEHKKAINKLLKIYPTFYNAVDKDNTEQAIDGNYRERAVALIKLRDRDQFLGFTKKSDKRIFFGGGKIDPGESAQDACLREIAEELGLATLTVSRKLLCCNTFFSYNQKTSHALEHWFLIEIDQQDLDNRTYAEIDEASHGHDGELVLVNTARLQLNNWNQLQWIIEHEFSPFDLNPTEMVLPLITGSKSEIMSPVGAEKHSEQEQKASRYEDETDVFLRDLVEEEVSENVDDTSEKDEINVSISLEDQEQLAETITWYDDHVEQYVLNSIVKRNDDEFKEWIDHFLYLIPPNGEILEIGSGFGRDADYMQSLGYTVMRSDASVSMVQLQQETGKDCQLFNVVNDTLDGILDGVIANGVFYHLTHEQFVVSLHKINNSLKNSGVLAFSLKEGYGNMTKDGKFYQYYNADEINELLVLTGFKVLLNQHINNPQTSATSWFLVIAQKNN